MAWIDTDDISDEEAAHHEAGHAVAASLLPDARPVLDVRMRSDLEGFRSHCSQEPIEKWLGPRGEVPNTEEFRAMVRADLVVIMAGPAAEARFVGDPDREHNGIYGDYCQAQMMADELLAAPEADVQQEAEETARELVERRWVAISIVAEALLKNGSLAGAEVRHLITQSGDSTPQH